MCCVINQGGQKLYALLYNIFIQYKWRKTYFINVSVVGYNSEVSLIYVKACWLRQAFILRLTDNVLAFIPLSEIRTLSQKDIYSKIFKEYRTCVNRWRTGKFFLFLLEELYIVLIEGSLDYCRPATITVVFVCIASLFKSYRFV